MFDQCIYFNTQALGRQLERAWALAFKPFELTPPQGFMLRALLEKPGMLQNELADSMKIARATATRTLDGLEARGLVERRPTKRDGRECQIIPTSAAEAMKVGLNEASHVVTNQLKAQLGSEAFEAFVGQVKTISGAMR